MAKTEKKSTIIKDALALFVITLVAGLALGFVYELTKEPIAQRALEEKTAAYASVFQEAEKFEEEEALKNAVADSANILANSGLEGVSVDEAFVALDASGNKIGYVMSVSSSKGFGGQITMSLGVTTEGATTGLEFLVINETAGLGSKAEDPAFKDQFVNKTVEQFEMVKTGASSDNQIDAIGGATVTSTAVTNAINAGLYFVTNMGGN